MICSTAATYAVRALVQLAAYDVDDPVRGRDLAEAAGIPRQYLTKVMQPLIKEGLVCATRGRNGGYKFVRPPSRISIASVVRAVDGPNVFAGCVLARGPCRQAGRCPIHAKWSHLSRRIAQFVELTTIGDLAAEVPATGLVDIAECDGWSRAGESADEASASLWRGGFRAV